MQDSNELDNGLVSGFYIKIYEQIANTAIKIHEKYMPEDLRKREDYFTTTEELYPGHNERIPENQFRKSICLMKYHLEFYTVKIILEVHHVMIYTVIEFDNREFEPLIVKMMNKFISGENMLKTALIPFLEDDDTFRRQMYGIGTKERVTISKHIGVDNYREADEKDGLRWETIQSAEWAYVEKLFIVKKITDFLYGTLDYCDVVTFNEDRESKLEASTSAKIQAGKSYKFTSLPVFIELEDGE